MNCYFSITMLSIAIFISFLLFFLLIAILFNFFPRCRERNISFTLHSWLRYFTIILICILNYDSRALQCYITRGFYIFYDKPNSITGMFDLVTAIPSLWWRFRANCSRSPRNSYWYLISAQWDIQRVLNIAYWYHSLSRSSRPASDSSQNWPSITMWFCAFCIIFLYI